MAASFNSDPSSPLGRARALEDAAVRLGLPLKQIAHIEKRRYQTISTKLRRRGWRMTWLSAHEQRVIEGLRAHSKAADEAVVYEAQIGRMRRNYGTISLKPTVDTQAIERPSRTAEDVA